MSDLTVWLGLKEATHAVYRLLSPTINNLT